MQNRKLRPVVRNTTKVIDDDDDDDDDSLLHIFALKMNYKICLHWQ